MNLPQNMGLTDRDLIESLIAAAFILDYGVVSAVSADKSRADVRHAIVERVAGQESSVETVTKGVEVLWPASAAFSARWELAAGDTVLLVGLRNYVRTVASGIPGKTDVPLHYTQECMKAVPLGAWRSSATITVEEAGGKLNIAGSSPAAARVGDQTIVDLTTDPTNLPFLVAVCAIFGMTLTPPLVGKVNAGSSKVNIGG